MNSKSSRLGPLFLALLMLVNPLPVWPSEKQTSAEKTSETEKEKTLKEVTVVGKRPVESGPFLADVQGTKIYAGKKTSVTRLTELPAITNNNYRQALVKEPGLLLSEETTPLLSLGYRGLEPHRAQFTQVMKDGIPIQADMFGYPESYYTPILQTVENIEFIRGGAALMYGPQPGGALNYVTANPLTDKKFKTFSENVFGTDNYFSTYEAVTGTLGPVGYLGYFHERQGDGFREKNSDFEVISSGIKMTVNQTGDSRLAMTYDEYHEEHGEPGGLSRTTAPAINYEQNREAATREFDRFRMERYYGTLAYEKEFSEKTQLDFKVYGGRYRRYSKRQRGGGFGTLPTGANAATNDIEEQDFYNLGFEPRLRHQYEFLGGDHTLSIGTHTFFSSSPREEQRGTTAAADSGALRKSSDRDTWYFSVFLENLFRWGRLAITPGVRLEHLWQHIHEKVNLDKTNAPLADEKTFDFTPLFGLGIVFDLGKTVEVYTNLSQSWRPKIFTQAVPTGSGQVVNDDLKEGFAWQYDLGLRGHPVSFFHWDIDYFILTFEDQIGTVGSEIKNVGDAFHQGMEFATEIDLIGAIDYFKKTDLGNQVGSFSPFVAFTLLDAEFTAGPNEDKEPQYTPPYNLRFGMTYQWRDRAKISLLSTFVGDHFADDAKTANRSVPSYKVWDLTAEVNLLKNAFGAFDLSFFGGINNLFDERYTARIRSDGIDPAYERNIYGGVKVSLG